MADFTALKTAIQNAIKQNGNEEITGNLLQEVLLAIVTTLGDGSINDLITALVSEATTRGNADSTLQQNINAEAQSRGNADTALGGRIDGVVSSIEAINNAIGNGYVYAGIATPSSTPTTGKVFYLALTAGTYTNFGATVVSQGINILKYNGSTWSLDTFVGLDDTPTPSSNNLVKSGGVFNDIMTNGSAFDLSAYNNGTTYADLNAALTALNALPAAYKKGGMSVKFVQSYDNNYVQYRLMAQSFTTDTTKWAIADEDVYVENPEFVDVKTDKDGKILWAIKTNGTVYFGAGVPTQVVDYIQQKIEELSLDEYEDIVAFLNGLEEGEQTLQQLLNEKANADDMVAALATKVDKVTGKSLIDEDVADSVQYTENPEFIDIKTDSDDKIIEGIKTDGVKVLPVGVDTPQINLDGVVTKTIENPEWIEAEVDNDDKILRGTKSDGSHYSYELSSESIDRLNNKVDTKVNKENGKSLIQSDVADNVSFLENPEFIDVETDANKKILGGRKEDGTKFERVGFETPSIDIGGVHVKNIEDIEDRISIETDSDDRIISYRGTNGVLHEEVGIKTNSLVLSENGMTEFQQALNDAGFMPEHGGNYSNMDVIELPEPNGYGLINFSIPELPMSLPVNGNIEYYDRNGNYFNLTCTLSVQGQTSATFALTGGKGNYTLDLPKDVKFGNWVPQDSFHLKGCAKDVTRSFLPTSYKWAYMMQDYLNAKPNRVLMNENAITAMAATGDRMTDWPSDARCIPDGFPVEIYVNGEYWGLYSFQLKKHRKNYSMDKKDYTSFFLDADAMMTSDYQNGLWNDGPDGATDDPRYASWWEGFEIKNPKDLICMDGSNYDGDNPKELIDSSSPYYDSTNKKHVGSARTKALIIDFSTRYLEVESYINNSDIVTAKEKFNEYFDYNACMFVYIFNCLMSNGDSIKKNTLWGIYGGGKIAPMLWDLDGVYGTTWTGTIVYPPSSSLWDGEYATAKWPLSLFWSLYQSEIESAYAELREAKLISIETWRNIIYNQWVNRIGEDAYKRDIEKWPETPSYRKNMTNTDYWREGGSGSGYTLWDDQSTYEVGAKVYLPMYPGRSEIVRYTAVQASNAENPQCPVTEFYDMFPQVGGYYDSPKRMEKWITEQIALCDAKMNYSE